MPTVFRPFVLPPSVNFYCNEEASMTQRLCLYNPYNFDILYKVDNGFPQKYSVSIRQGVISSRQKMYIEVSCRQRDPSVDDSIQIRFFKWPRPRHGAKPRTQQYIGFRDIKLYVYSERGDREPSPSPSHSYTEADFDMMAGSSEGVVNPSLASAGYYGYGVNQNPSSYGTGTATTTSLSNRRTSHDGGTGSVMRGGGGAGSSRGGSSITGGGGSSSSRKVSVAMSLISTIVLLLLGLVFDRTDSDWFSSTFNAGLHPHTLAVVCYTLSCVLLLKLLTFR